MPPIKVHTASPINAAKASGITPQTTAPANNDDDASLAATVTTTTNQPINTTTATPTRTIPPSQGPPPPQPGAVPRLPQATGTATSSLPPPPRAGAAPGSAAGVGASPAAPAPTAAPALAPQIPGLSYPPQMNIPSPSVPAMQRGTSTAAAGPAATGQGGLWGNAGYGQNSSGGGGYAPPSSLPFQQGGGDQEAGQEGFLGSAMKLAKAAGGKLSAAESEVWRRINGEEK